MKFDPSKPYYRRVGGQCFQRQADGSVTIAQVVGPPNDAEPMIEREHTIPADEWAEILATVSFGGTSAEVLEAAKRLHDGYFPMLGYMRVHPAGAEIGEPEEEEHEQQAAVKNLQIEV